MRFVLKGVPQEDIRRALGLSRGVLHHYLYGDRQMSLRVALRFEQAYGIKPALWLEPIAKPFDLVSIVTAQHERTLKALRTGKAA